MAVPFQSVEEVGSQRAAPGPSAASFDRFFLMYARRVRGLLRPYVGRGRADDLTQETLLRAFRRGLHLEEDGDPWPWLSRVARNLAVDTARRHRHLVEVSLDADGDDLPTEVTPHSEWLAARRREGIATALTAIPDGPRRMLLARHLDGLRYEQIAETEGVSVAVVRSALFRAKQIFREEYDEVAARRGIQALFPFGIARLRERLRSLRMHVEGLFQRPGAEGISGAASALHLVQGAATAVALGVVATAGTLLPGLGESGALPAGSGTTTPVSVPMAAIAESTEVGGGTSPPVTAPDRASVTASVDAGVRTSRPRPEPEPPGGNETEVPHPPRRVQSDVDTQSTAIGAGVPADATASTDGGDKGDAAGVSSRGEVTVDADEVDTDVDDDGSDDVDTSVTMSRSTAFDCSSPEEHGLVTSTACGLEAETTGE